MRGRERRKTKRRQKESERQREGQRQRQSISTTKKRKIIFSNIIKLKTLFSFTPANLFYIDGMFRC